MQSEWGKAMGTSQEHTAGDVCLILLLWQSQDWQQPYSHQVHVFQMDTEHTDQGLGFDQIGERNPYILKMV